MFIWEKIKDFLNASFREKFPSLQNHYFPLVLTESTLRQETAHLDGFSAELAWITAGGDRSLEVPLALRPTSEAIICRYLRETRVLTASSQLPLRIGQWCNVIRWETKTPVPFIRSKEVLWHEGHSWHQTREEALQELQQIIGIYRDCYEKLLAVPVVSGLKSPRERFAGAEQSLSLEALIPEAARSVQACTAHYLGQQFSKMFEISVTGAGGDAITPEQNSWGISIRSVGISVLVHGDSIGCILPPAVAPVQVIIVPCGEQEESRDAILSRCHQVDDQLKSFGLRSQVDDQRGKSAGRKFFSHEVAGVPLRIEVGPREVEDGSVVCVERIQPPKRRIVSDLSTVSSILQSIQQNLFQIAAEKLHSSIGTPIEDADVFLGSEKAFLSLFLCDKALDCEEQLLKMNKRGKILCFPEKSSPFFSTGRCLICKKENSPVAIFGNSF